MITITTFYIFVLGGEDDCQILTRLKETGGKEQEKKERGECGRVS